MPELRQHERLQLTKSVEAVSHLADPRILSSPKLEGNASWYPYYAGYSESFVRDILREMAGSSTAMHVLDPWNGSGTRPLSQFAMASQQLLDLTSIRRSS